MGTYIDCILIPTAVIGSKIDTHGLVAENSVIVEKKLSTVLIGEAISRSIGNPPK